MRNPDTFFSIAVVGLVLAISPTFAQNNPAATNVQKEPARAQQSSLVVGALQIGSAPNLEAVGIDINVAVNAIVYSYFLKNTDSTELDLTATVSLPELRASDDGSETWVLASNDPENPVGFSVTSAGTPVTTTVEVHAYALGLGRLAEIKAEHLPLIPFGPEVDKALASLSTEAADRLAALGIISSRNPTQPKAPATANWSLDVIRSWRQVLLPQKTTPVVINFTPVAAQYSLAKGDQNDVNDMQDDLCLSPQVLGALQSRLKGGGGWKVTEISLAVGAPAHWVDSPNPTLSVQRPTSDAIVAFCGIDAKTASKPVILGVAPDDSDEIRIVIFEPAAK
jgi:hypothetical protein